VNLYRKPENFLIRLAEKISFFVGSFFVWEKSVQISTRKGLALIGIVSALLLFLTWAVYPKDSADVADFISVSEKTDIKTGISVKEGFVPGPISMEKMKTKGCDGQSFQLRVSASGAGNLEKPAGFRKSPGDHKKD